MFRKLLIAAGLVVLAADTASAQRGGGGHGGGYGGGHGYGGYGYGRGYGGWYGGISFYGYGWGYPYAYGYGPGFYDLGGLGYSGVGGFGGGGSGAIPAPTLIPYSSSYTPGQGPKLDPTTIPTLPPPLANPELPAAPVAKPAAAAATASITVIVPEGGQVWFDNTLTPTKGTSWSFTTTALEQGKTYTVNVKARWDEKGNDRSYDIPVRVVSGDKLTLDLTKIR
jgi:uncharacterized protein (TIGR03000 family)